MDPETTQTATSALSSQSRPWNISARDSKVDCMCLACRWIIVGELSIPSQKNIPRD